MTSHFASKQSRLDIEAPVYAPYKWMGKYERKTCKTLKDSILKKFLKFVEMMKTSPLFGYGHYPHQISAHLPFMPHPAMMFGGHLPSLRPNGLPEAPKDLSNPKGSPAFDRYDQCDVILIQIEHGCLLMFLSGFSQLEKNITRRQHLMTRDHVEYRW